MRKSIPCLLRWLKIIFIVIFSSLWVLAVFNFNSRVIYSIPHYVFAPSDDEAGHSPTLFFKFCLLQSKSLVLQKVNIHSAPELSDISAANQVVLRGGQWQPEACIPFQKVAIVIPYRDRWTHLRILLDRLHPMLRRQNIDYRIFVMEQTPGTPFNRGMLMNVGVTEALKTANFDCFVFHDVDLIPEHDRNIYLCDDHARHLSSAIDEMRYHVMYENYAGGVMALTRENVFKINGYPNSYWGWGNEDDDFSARTLASGLKLSRPPEYIGRYKMVRHKKADRSAVAYPLFLKWRHRQHTDGLNSLTAAMYRVVSLREENLYTNVTVHLHNPGTVVDSSGKSENYLWFLRFYGLIW